MHHFCYWPEPVVAEGGFRSANPSYIFCAFSDNNSLGRMMSAIHAIKTFTRLGKWRRLA